MRSEEEVIEKFRESSSKLLKERKAKYLSVNNLNCAFNSRYKLKEGKVGLCTNQKILYNSGKKIVLCDSKDCAKSCSEYNCKYSELSVVEDFNNILKNPCLCGQEYPKLAILLWFLQKEGKYNNRFKRFLFSCKNMLISIKSFLFFGWW